MYSRKFSPVLPPALIGEIFPTNFLSHVFTLRTCIRGKVIGHVVVVVVVDTKIAKPGDLGT